MKLEQIVTDFRRSEMVAIIEVAAQLVDLSDGAQQVSGFEILFKPIKFCVGYHCSTLSHSASIDGALPGLVSATPILAPAAPSLAKVSQNAG